MKARIIFTLLLLSALLIAMLIDCTLDFAYASFGILIVVGTAGAVEWNRMMREGIRTYSGLLVAAAVAYPVLECARIRAGWNAGHTDSMFLFVVLLLLLSQAVFSGHVKDGLDRIGRTLLGFMLLYLFYRLVPVLLYSGAGRGPALAYLLVITSKSCDIGAYLIGRTFGKRKLIPRVSPGKTVAGAVGGLALSAAVGGICFAYLPASPIRLGIFFGLLIGAVTMLSDLAESLIKRCAGVKDSAALLPEMGGVLDLIDSLILAAPAGYIFFSVFQIIQRPI